MKLIIQIPCFNEARTLPLVFQDMPREFEGVDEVEFQIVDDGSTDDTVAVAKSLGIHHIVSMGGQNRRWLGRAFQAGLENALRVGADILVNTDGDNQYPSAYIAQLIQPIVEERAHIVIGNRAPGSLSSFTPTKRFLQRLGNRLISLLTGNHVPDAVSGFRAFSRKAMLRTNVITNYTYTVDTLIQAYKKGLDVEWIDIYPNPQTRPSRLIPSLFTKIRKSGLAALRLSIIYHPLKSLSFLAALFLIPGLIGVGHWLGAGSITSLVAGGVCLGLGLQLVLFAVIGDMLAANRTLIEGFIERQRELTTAPRGSLRTISGNALTENAANRRYR